MGICHKSFENNNLKKCFYRHQRRWSIAFLADGLHLERVLRDRLEYLNVEDVPAGTKFIDCMQLLQ